MSKTTEKKVTAVAEVKPAAVAVTEPVAEVTKEVPKLAEKKKGESIFMPGRAAPKTENHPEEQIAVNVGKVDKLEIEKIKDVELKSYFNFWNDDKNKVESDAESSFFINGEKQIPLLTGIKVSPQNLADLRVVDRYRQYNSPLLSTKKEGEYDVYVYKLEINRTKPHSGTVQEITKLEGLFISPPIYQILILSKGSVVNITDEIKSPNPWGASKKVLEHSVGKLVVTNATLSNIVFAGSNWVEGVELINSRLVDSSITSGHYGKNKLQHLFVDDSHLENLSLSDTRGGINLYREFEIKRSHLKDVHFKADGLTVSNSRLTDSSFSADWLRIAKSRVNNVTINAKERIDLRALRYFAPDRVQFSVDDSVCVTNVYDFASIEVDVRSQIHLIKGKKGHWVCFNSDFGWDEGVNQPSALVIAKTAEELNLNPRQYGFGHPFHRNHDSISSMREEVTKFVNRVLGRSEITETLITSIVNSINSRIEISRSISVSLLLTNNQDSHF